MIISSYVVCAAWVGEEILSREDVLERGRDFEQGRCFGAGKIFWSREDVLGLVA